MNEAQLARVLLDHTELLYREADRFNLKVCKTDSRDAWTFYTQTWMPGRAGRTDDEIDDDIDGPMIVKKKLSGIAIADVFLAMDARDDLIYLINRCRSKEIAYEEALAISYQDSY